MTKNQYSAQSEELEKLIRQKAYNDIVAFLVSEMLRDSEVKKNFLARFSPRQITVNDMVSDFKSICSFYMGRKRFIDYSHAHFISNLVVLAELMLQRGDGVVTVESMLAPFRCSCRILAWLANLAESNGNQEKEYELLQEGLALAQKKHQLGMINEFGVKLCRFYQRTNQIERYKYTLKNLLLSNPHHLEYYNEYKALYSKEEWSIERDTIIGTFEKQKYQPHTLFEMYKEEKMYNQLLKLIETRGGLKELKEYQKVLESQYPNEVMRLYLANLDMLVSQKGSKRHYEHIIFWMKHIRKLTGVHEVIKEKAKEYAALYKRRPSFIRELSCVNW